MLFSHSAALREGSYKAVKGIRAVSVLPKSNAVVVMFYLNSTGSVDMALFFQSILGNSTETVRVVSPFLINWDAHVPYFLKTCLPLFVVQLHPKLPFIPLFNS